MNSDIKKIKRIVITVLAITAVTFISAYACYHSLSVFDEIYMTGVVKHGNASIDLDMNAVVFYDARLIETEIDGGIRYLVSDGEKVAKNDEIARIYPGMSDTEDYSKRLREITDNIEFLEECLNIGHITYYEAGNNALSSYYSYISAVANAATDTKQLYSTADKMLLSLNKFNIVRNGKNESANKIAQLKAEYENILSKYSGSYTSIYASKSEYFFDASSVDGYESICCTSALKYITPDSLRALANSNPLPITQNTIGKSMDTYKWYIAAIVNSKDAENFETNTTYTLHLKESGISVSAELVKISSELQNENVLVFECGEMPAGYEFNRFVTASVEIMRYEGLSVPRSAIHDVDGKIGVYVLKRGKLIFKRAEILYEHNGVCIISDGSEYEAAENEETATAQATENTENNENIENNQNKDERLFPDLNDVILISGTDLYDGKIIG